ncbi:hypothetical protein [Algoriphagus terrigena]|uniref:hypothetical protein n=1 Tax=Algoriphagus terrigena TaxID=344884 RepID=UPI0003F4D130|nr:hypothetical protein [Algoriphagus terrigena]
MQAGHIKGAILEFIIRNILKSCGFTNVVADPPYTFKDGDLFKINGKGAAHDADVIMEPPIQIPFSYPMRIIFECKAYADKIKLEVVRNAAGLREDINNFEIVTKDFLNQRIRKKRSEFAFENRNRHLYQVGVASVGEFTKPAIEFAVNNKIPLFSINENFDSFTATQINLITQTIIDSFDQDEIQNLYTFLKDREGDLDDPKYQRALKVLQTEGPLGDITSISGYLTKRTNVGILNNGQIIFLYSVQDQNLLFDSNMNLKYKAELHWHRPNYNSWTLEVFPENDATSKIDFKFFLPAQILKEWGDSNFDKAKALELKGNYFSKIMVFNKGGDNIFPLSIIKLDENWLSRLKSELNENPGNEPY